MIMYVKYLAQSMHLNYNICSCKLLAFAEH